MSKPDPGTREGRDYQKKARRLLLQKEGKTPCGYPPRPIQSRNGSRYLVQPSGQILRVERKMGKAERKRHKRARRARESGHQNP